MDTQNAVHPNGGILLGHEEEGGSETRMNFENTMLSEICLIQKDKYCMFYLLNIIVKLIEIENRIAVMRA